MHTLSMHAHTKPSQTWSPVIMTDVLDENKADRLMAKREHANQCVNKNSSLLTQHKMHEISIVRIVGAHNY